MSTIGMELTYELDGDLAAVIYSHPLHFWRAVSDDHLPLPIERVSRDAYFRYEADGKVSGNDWRHWFEAEAACRNLFREIVGWLEEELTQEQWDMDSSIDDEYNAPTTEVPMLADVSRHLRSGNEQADGQGRLGTMDRMDNTGEIGEILGNPFSSISPEEWSEHAGKFAAIACDGRGILVSAETITRLYQVLADNYPQEDHYLIQAIPDLTGLTKDQYTSLCESSRNSDAG